MRIYARLCALILLVTPYLFSQNDRMNGPAVYVDGEGIMRWEGSDKEVRLFGVNYTAPFAYAYRAHKRLGLSVKQAIDLDVGHMARLGFDAFRVHVWDREISDANGNLLANEHLDLFDYLVKKLGERGIRIIVTPIAWWGNGWPEPDEVTKGFSQFYPRLELITNPKARKAEQNYLTGFVNHVNPYTRRSYKDDPDIIALEVINEPTHPEDEQAVTEYIDDMVGVVRKAGFAKPVFYNISQNWSNVQANAVTRSSADGISFQWYPTDLVHGRMLTGNYLVNVNTYAVPSDSVVNFGTKTKMVYEFDAADVGASYMYPAMARSFREAGMQFATMFSYDPVQLAWSNTEYPTHYMNLLYTPSKAISLMIAGRAFHQLPLMKSYGRFPDNNRFGDFLVSYEKDLSQLNADSEFVYSNTTDAVPKNAGLLRHVAGCGSSVVVRYDGTGAYFLDKLEKGIWRLEVYPDVLWIRDPFDAAGTSRPVARLFRSQRIIHVSLPDLGQTYAMRSISASGKVAETGPDHAYSVLPGCYLLTSSSVDKGRTKKYLGGEGDFLEGLYSPPPANTGIYVVNKSSSYGPASGGAHFAFQIAGEPGIQSATLFVRRPGWRGFVSLPLIHGDGFTYAVTDTGREVHSGVLEYCVAVQTDRGSFTFPDGLAGVPGSWDFSPQNLWHTTIVALHQQFALLDVDRDRRDFVFPHFTPSMRYSIDYVNGVNSEEKALSAAVRFSGASAVPFGVQLATWNTLGPVRDQLAGYSKIVLRARSTDDSASTVGIVFLTSDGKSFGADVVLSREWEDIETPLTRFRERAIPILPNSYPLFLPKVWNANAQGSTGSPDLRKLQSLMIVVDPPPNAQTDFKFTSRFELISVSLKE